APGRGPRWRVERWEPGAGSERSGPASDRAWCSVWGWLHSAHTQGLQASLDALRRGIDDTVVVLRPRSLQFEPLPPTHEPLVQAESGAGVPGRSLPLVLARRVAPLPA